MEEKEIESAPGRSFMGIVVNGMPLPPQAGDLITGTVVMKDKATVYVDIGLLGTGVIFGREYLNARDIIKNTKIGDAVTAKVVEAENQDGYVELSLREAKQAVVWKEAALAIKNRETFELVVKDFNKGGLMLEWGTIVGFLPASQLKAEHYPRVADGDKEKIAQALSKLVGKKIKASIITADPEEGKLIFSEKSSTASERGQMIAKYNVGDIVKGEVTGSVEFGIFVKIEEGLEGLVHISEMDWSLVENPKERYKPGEVIEAKIIEIKDDKISLSIKALKENPWTKAGDKYKKDDVVKGVVIKFNKYGALISIEEGVAGLIHISEFANEEELRKKLELGKTYDFKIALFEPKEQKLTLRLSEEES